MSAERFRRTQALGEEAAPRGWAEVPLLRDLGVHELAALERTLVEVRFDAGATLLRQGEPGDCLYLLEAGTVTVRVDRAGSPTFTRSIVAPDTLGEMALVTRAPRSATVVAASAVRCRRLDRDRFEALVAAHPAAADVVTRLVGERLLEIDGIRQVGKYDVTGPLGAGAVAYVYAGRHRELGTEVALKMLAHAAVYHPHFAAQFDREAQIIARLDHPNVVRVIDTEAAYGTRFIVMERLRGALLEERMGPAEPRPWEAVRRIARDVCGALEHAHEHGLVHRDVKPANIFVAPDGGARLLDFGIAIGRERSTCVGAARLGTPCYMAPEQILGRPLDGRTDLYALGLSLYEVVTGRVPFMERTLEALLRLQLDAPLPDPRLLTPDVPEDLVAFMRRCAAKRAVDRFGSAAEAAAALTGEGTDGLILRIRHAPAADAAVRAALGALREALAGRDDVQISEE